MHTPKIPQTAVKLKIYKGSIMAGVSCGHEAMGLAPQTREPTSCSIMQPRHQDPDYGAFIAQVKVYLKFYGNWPAFASRSQKSMTSSQ